MYAVCSENRISLLANVDDALCLCELKAYTSEMYICSLIWQYFHFYASFEWHQAPLGVVIKQTEQDGFVAGLQ